MVEKTSELKGMLDLPSSQDYGNCSRLKVRVFSDGSLAIYVDEQLFSTVLMGEMVAEKSYNRQNVHTSIDPVGDKRKGT